MAAAAAANLLLEFKIPEKRKISYKKKKWKCYSCKSMQIKFISSPIKPGAINETK